MGLRATSHLGFPLEAGMRPADLVRLCPGCETPLAESPGAGPFAIQECPQCGLSVMTLRDRNREQ